MEFRPTIGLEIHAELYTKTKMFCACKNDPNETRPNINICPICVGHPGTLPVANREAIRHVLRIGSAVGGSLADFSEFDRKSYFYPDIPKGYQISQYERPLVTGGALAGVSITRVHLEEDTARSLHAEHKSLVDFNRAGIPLMELVTEPVIHDAKTAGTFARELQLLLRTLGAGGANLEKGEMRIEANVSVSARDGELGTKVEVKNLNSFRSVERAIEYEIERQAKVLTSGGSVTQETRGWNEAKQETFSQRLKEGSADYRYFPEPDLAKVIRSEVDSFSDASLRSALPELPDARRERLGSLGVFKPEQIAILTSSKAASQFIDAVGRELKHEASLLALSANYLLSDLAGEAGRIEPGSFAKLMRMLQNNQVSSRGAKDLLTVMKDSGGDPEVLAREKGLLQIDDSALLKTIVEKVVTSNPKVVADYKGGKPTALQYLVGQAMKETKGAGNPTLLKEMFTEVLQKTI